MVHQCCVKGCKSRADNKTKSRRISFFTFPDNRPALKTSWLRAIGRPGWDPHGNRICSIHFKPELIRTKGPRILLNRRAVPELKLPASTGMEASTLEVCRICLVSDVKMHSFETGLLKTCMESILKLTENAEIIGLPTLVCYECAPLLLKCHNVMQKCLLAQTALSNIYTEHGEVTKEMIRKLNREKINLASTLTHHYNIKKTIDFVYNEETNTSELLKTKCNKEEKIKTDIEATSKVDLKVYPEITIKKYCPSITKMETELDSMKMEEEPTIVEEPEETDFVNDFDDNIDDVLVESDGNDDDKETQDEIEEIQEQIEIEILDENTAVDKRKADSSEKHTSSESGNSKEYKGLLRKMQQYFDIEDLETKEQQVAVWQEYKGINPEDAKHEFECNNCSKTFAYEKAYKKHIVKHTGPPNILCPLCKKGRFKNEESMREHYTANHSRKFTCKICSKMFPNFAFAERHYMSSHKQNAHKCAECAFLTPHLHQLHAHMRAAHNARHVCTRCARAFTAERAMKLHMAVAHGICEQKQEFKCEECNLSFVTEEAKKTHLLVSERHKEGCKPTEQVVLVATCLKCGCEFASDLELRVHNNTDHARPSDDAPQKFKYPKKCDFCDTILTSRGDHWNHIQRRHPDKKNTYKPIVNYICQICGKGVGSTTKLEDHMARHEGTPKYKCDICEKPFYEKIRLKIHKLVHSDEPQYHCDVCGRRFKTRDSMKKHQKVVHTNELNYSCTYCGHKFKSADSLRIHKKSHLKDLATTSTWDETFSSF